MPSINPEDYRSYDALIFDMDGTLIDSGRVHEEAWRKTLTRHGIPVDGRLMRSLAGVPTRATLEHLAAHFKMHSSINIDAATECKEHYASQLRAQYLKATPLETVVRYFYGDKPMAVGTGATTQEAVEVIDLCGLKHYFGAIVGADRVVHPKPAADTFLLCARELGVEPARCLVFEDAPLGLKAARDAGMDAIDVAQQLNILNHYFLEH